MRNNYFSDEEFHCKCGACNYKPVKEELIERLNIARSIAGIPFVITSGYRCPKHNARVGGAPNSKHTKGEAVDIRVRSSEERFRILASVVSAGFERIGVSDGFIHVDVHPADTPVIWTY